MHNQSSSRCLDCTYIYIYTTQHSLLKNGSSPCGGGLEHRCSPSSRTRRHKGNPVPGEYLGHPVAEEHKQRNLVLQVGGSTQGSRPCSENIYVRREQRAECGAIHTLLLTPSNYSGTMGTPGLMWPCSELRHIG
jgi:hypothetical protein